MSCTSDIGGAPSSLLPLTWAPVRGGEGGVAGLGERGGTGDDVEQPADVRHRLLAHHHRLLEQNQQRRIGRRILAIPRLVSKSTPDSSVPVSPRHRRPAD